MIKLFYIRLNVVLVSIVLTVAQHVMAQQNCADVFSDSVSRTSSIYSNTPATVEDLFSSLDRLIRTQSQNIPERMFTDPIVQDIRDGKVQFLQAFSDLYKNGNLNSILANSRRSPQILPGGNAMKYGFGSGLALYKGRIFINSYFMQHGLHNPGTTALLTKGQPFFIYNKTTHEFEFKADGAQEEIIRLFSLDFQSSDLVSINRGMTSLSEKEIVEVIQQTFSDKILSRSKRQILSNQVIEASRNWKKLSGNNTQLSDEILIQYQNLAKKLSTEPWSHKLQLEISKKLSELFINSNTYFGKDAIFSTPNFETAKNWGQFGVVSALVPMAELTKFANTRGIYVGIEGGIEFALIEREIQRLFLQQGQFH